jgi:hypothetical protein
MLYLVYLLIFRIFWGKEFKRLGISSSRLEISSDENIEDLDFFGLRQINNNDGNGGAIKISGGACIFNSLYFLHCEAVCYYSY